ncbi:active regulator of SIRT1 [Hyperolius riggenbachi]|uniref:active regulator of SIRT1 n=1 Tax=Hyperolius riggenbachi TaxID=752182 RepID=UPI0035A37B8E
MSVSLLRKGLELLGAGPAGTGKKSGNGSNKVSLNSNKIGMKKQLKRLKRQGTPQTQRASAKNRVIKSAVEEYKKRTSEDHLQENLRYMLGTYAVTKKDVVNKIVSQHGGRKARDRREKKEKKVKETSIFSESDFRRFEKEYFGKR